MDGWLLLVIGLVSLGLVVAAFAYLGICAYRLVKAGIRLARTYGPLTAELSRRAAVATERAAEAGAQAQEIQASLERLQVSLQRLQVVTDAWRTAATPYQRVRKYFGR